MAQGDLICVCKNLLGECKEDGARPFSVAPRDRTGGRRHKFNSWRSLNTGKTFGCEDGRTPKQAAQSGHRVSIDLLDTSLSNLLWGPAGREWDRDPRLPPAAFPTGLPGFAALQIPDKQIKLNSVLQAETIKIYLPHLIWKIHVHPGICFKKYLPLSDIQRYYLPDFATFPSLRWTKHANWLCKSFLQNHIIIFSHHQITINYDN